MNIHEKNINLDIDFPEIKGNPTVFIDKIILDESALKTLNSQIPRQLYIFGTTVKTGEIHPEFGEFKRLEFIVVEKDVTTNKQIQHHLYQDDSIMYKREIDKTNYECVDMLQKKDILYLKHQPKWKASTASIPKYNEKLFFFCSQTYIPENKTTKKFLGWGETIFVFLYVTDQDQLLIQLFIQDTSAQTAEDHYKLEEQMCEFDENHKKTEVVKKLIKNSDKHLHNYILNHKKTDKETLKLLFEYGKSNAFKKEVEKKLKQY